jgi:hypothetical protein
LIRGDRNDRSDTVLAQVFADGAGGVGLVCRHDVRPGAGPAGAAGNTHACHHVGEGGCITGLSGGQHEGRRSAVRVGGKVDLRGQAAAGPADGVAGGLAGRGLFLRAPAACW